MNDLISIIIPVYNVEKYLKDCLESVIMQTYPNLEIILVDDGATDNCPQICDEYAKKDKRIKVIHQKNAGLSAARNTGLDMASGEYIVFQDSDDTIEPTTIEELYRIAKKFKVKLSICGRNYVFENGKKIRRVKQDVEQKFSFEDAVKEMNKYYYFDMSAHGKLYDKKLFKDIRFPVGKLSEDFFIMPTIFMSASEVAYISKPLYNYLQRTSSITHCKSINEDFITAAREQMNLLENSSKNLRTITHVAYANSVLTVADAYIRNNVHLPKEKLSSYRNIIQKNTAYLRKSNDIGATKRLQIMLFMNNYQAYKIAYRIFHSIREY